MGGKSTAAFMVATEYAISKVVLEMDISKECAFCIAGKDPREKDALPKAQGRSVIVRKKPKLNLLQHPQKKDWKAQR